MKLPISPREGETAGRPEGGVKSSGHGARKSIPLPPSPHIPGRTPRPESGAFIKIADRAPDPTDPEKWRDNEAWLAGFDLYRAGYFWEAHEVWEPVWMNAGPNSPERRLAQGLIQLANACLKLVMERPRAALRLLDHAVECLDDARVAGGEALMGIDRGAAAMSVRAFRDLATSEFYGASRLLEQRPVLNLEQIMQDNA